uniref:6-phosphofructo-2-kinase/fructose-2,6-biphosphatase 1 n=1 Tax=Vombatus ursinus TaxID=29139 RepID=A0A4X2LJF4_VOMUR
MSQEMGELTQTRLQKIWIPHTSSSRLQRRRGSSIPQFTNSPTMVIMVGLPARGKTYISTKLTRYLNWIGTPTKVFNLGQYRREAVQYKNYEFFRPDNKEALVIRKQCALAALKDVHDYLGREEGHVAVFDATNTTRERRSLILQFAKEHGYKVFFIESICDDPHIIAENITQVKLSSPDYKDCDREKVVEDFLKRIECYEMNYQPIDEELDRSEKRSTVQARTVSPLDPSVPRIEHSKVSISLLPVTLQYAYTLANFIQSQDISSLKVWTSHMKRTIQTAEALRVPYEQWKALNEIDAGVCEEMTYEEIQQHYPEEFALRDQDKYRYRYPKGEVRGHLPAPVPEPQGEPPRLVSGPPDAFHSLTTYPETPPTELPYLKCPLHTVLKLTPVAYGCKVDSIYLNVEAVNTHREKPENVDVTREPEEALDTVPAHY